MKRFVYNPDTLSYDEQRLPWWQALIRFIVAAVGAVAVVGAALWLYFVYLGKDLPKTAILRSQNEAWQSRMGVIRHKLDVYETTLRGVEDRNDKVYRTIFALDPLKDPAYTDTCATAMESLNLRLDAVQNRINIQMSSLGEVAVVAKEAGDMVSHIPAVPPVLPKKGTYNLSSPFGTRVDPVYGGAAQHLGQDIASSVGNPVYATGDGVVERVRYQFFGYGNEVVIDHGFGYKTRYAHLNSIDVAKGQTLKRGQKIGTVGSTGKSTGPHLHYEVIYKGKQINPSPFMDLSIKPEEYKSMVRTAADEQL